MTASRNRLPGKRWRTSTTAHITPNRVLSGTAMPAISSDSQNAWSASGAVTACHTAAAPSPNARHTTAPTGTSSTAAR
jgi:hypothetical protein